MNTVDKTEQSTGTGKKEARKKLAEKIMLAIPELKEALGEKKFEHRAKKAAKLLTEGIYKKETGEVEAEAETEKARPAKKAAAPKKVAAKKAKAAKKATV